ncbi:uncharacterized protein METZ01_LOCUS193985, partial [marine metagenome]
VQPGGRFWQGCWSTRSVVVVEINGYTIEPGANLEGADLNGVNLEGANLSDAYLNGANLEGADLTSTFADKDTRWPEGFDPKAAGVTFT